MPLTHTTFPLRMVHLQPILPVEGLSHQSLALSQNRATEQVGVAIFRILHQQRLH